LGVQQRKVLRIAHGDRHDHIKDSILCPMQNKRIIYDDKKARVVYVQLTPRTKSFIRTRISATLA
jgi:hypothetical protein